jgi:hypothetical protein
MIKKFRIFEIDGSELNSYSTRRSFESKEEAEEFIKSLRVKDMMGRLELIVLEVWTNV